MGVIGSNSSTVVKRPEGDGQKVTNIIVPTGKIYALGEVPLAQHTIVTRPGVGGFGVDGFAPTISIIVPAFIEQTTVGLILEDDFQDRIVGPTVGGGWVEVDQVWDIDDLAGNKRVRSDDVDGPAPANLQWQTANSSEAFLQALVAMSTVVIAGLIIRWKGSDSGADRNGYILTVRRPVTTSIAIGELTANTFNSLASTSGISVDGSFHHAQFFADDGIQEGWWSQDDSTVAAASTAHDGPLSDRYFGFRAAAASGLNNTVVHDDVIACLSKNLLVTNLPTGWKAKVRNGADAVVAEATESGGTATIDCSRYTEVQVAGTGATEVVPLGGWPKLQITNGADVEKDLWSSADAGFVGVYPGDVYKNNVVS